MQSNLVRIAAAAARRLGMEAHIQLEDRVDGMGALYRTSGNLLLDRVLGATLHSFPEGEDEAAAAAAMERRAAALAGEGRRPEGWDNPNVFQICTLNETQSTEKKRQEIGRGLRLPVNESGERVHDETVNQLTVIANESYEDFARTLQTEFEEDFGIRFGKVERIAFAGLVRVADDGTETEMGQDESARIWTDLVREGYLNEAGDILDRFDRANPHFELKVSDEFADLKAEIIDEIDRKVFKNRIVNARERRQLRFRKEVQLSREFQELWERIKHRTRYRVTFDTAELIDRALSRVRRIETVRPPRVATTVVEVDISEAGVSADRQIATRFRDVNAVKVLPDILAFLQKETELTRHTLTEILKRSSRLAEFKVNPQAFMPGRLGRWPPIWSKAAASAPGPGYGGRKDRPVLSPEGDDLSGSPGEYRKGTLRLRFGADPRTPAERSGLRRLPARGGRARGRSAVRELASRAFLQEPFLQPDEGSIVRRRSGHDQVIGFLGNDREMRERDELSGRQLLGDHLAMADGHPHAVDRRLDDALVKRKAHVDGKLAGRCADGPGPVRPVGVPVHVVQQGLADDLVGAGVGGQRLAELRAADGKDLFSEQPRDTVAGMLSLRIHDPRIHVFALRVVLAAVNLDPQLRPVERLPE